MFKDLLTAVRDFHTRRRRYRRLLTEIDALNARDLLELRADATDLRKQVRSEMYG